MKDICFHAAYQLLDSLIEFYVCLFYELEHLGLCIEIEANRLTEKSKIPLFSGCEVLDLVVELPWHHV